MASKASSKLKNFLEHGAHLHVNTELDLASGKDKVLAVDDLEEALTVDPTEGAVALPGDDRPKNDPDAKERLPTTWTTPDRILDVWLMTDQYHKKRRNPKSRNNRVNSPDSVAEQGKQDKDHDEFHTPAAEELIHIDVWERQNKRRLSEMNADELISKIGWVFVKWQDLQYDASTFDSPIPRDSPQYSAFYKAFRNFLYARTVKIPVLTKAEAHRRDSRKPNGYTRLMGKQPECIKNGVSCLFSSSLASFC